MNVSNTGSGRNALGVTGAPSVSGHEFVLCDDGINVIRCHFTPAGSRGGICGRRRANVIPGLPPLAGWISRGLKARPHNSPWQRHGLLNVSRERAEGPMHGRRIKMNYEQNVPGLQPLASSQYQPMAAPWADMSRAVGPMMMCTLGSSRRDGPDPESQKNVAIVIPDASELGIRNLQIRSACGNVGFLGRSSNSNWYYSFTTRAVPVRLPLLSITVRQYTPGARWDTSSVVLHAPCWITWPSALESIREASGAPVR